MIDYSGNKYGLLYEDLIQKSFFKKLMVICQHDDTYSYIGSKIRTMSETWFFKCYKFQLVFLFFELLQKYYLHWNLSEAVIPWLNIPVDVHNLLFYAVHIIAILGYLVNIISDTRDCGIASVLNIAVVIATMKFVKNGLPYYEIILAGIAIQAVISIIENLYLLKFINYVVKKNKKELGETTEKYDLYEEHYNETIQVLSKEYEGYGKSDYLTGKPREFWWQNHQYKTALMSGEKWPYSHRGSYEKVKVEEYDYWNPVDKTNVKGKTTTKTTKCYDKDYIMHDVDSLHYNSVWNHIRRDNFKPICRFDMYNATHGGACNVTAVECICRVTTKNDVDTDDYVRSAPTQSQIDEARDRINEKYDDRERWQNLGEYGRYYTTEQMVNEKGLTAEMWEKSQLSKNWRETDVNNYISKNTKISRDSSSYRGNGFTKEYSAVIAYIVDGCVLYNPQLEKDLWVPDGYTLKENDNYYKNRQEEIEAMLHYLIKNNHEFKKELIETVWDDSSEMASKIMHTFSEDFDVDCEIEFKN